MSLPLIVSLNCAAVSSWVVTSCSTLRPAAVFPRSGRVVVVAATRTMSRSGSPPRALKCPLQRVPAIVNDRDRRNIDVRHLAGSPTDLVAQSLLVAAALPLCQSQRAAHRTTRTPPSPALRQANRAPRPSHRRHHRRCRKDHIEGLVRSVSGNAIQLTQRDRSAATVDFTPQTMVTELSSAALTDVKPGSCVDVKSGPQSASPGGAITAESVEISPAVANMCPPPPGRRRGLRHGGLRGGQRHQGHHR